MKNAPDFHARAHSMFMVIEIATINSFQLFGVNYIVPNINYSLQIVDQLSFVDKLFMGLQLKTKLLHNIIQRKGIGPAPYEDKEWEIN